MEKKTIPVIVTLSGKVELEIKDGMTAAEVRELVMKHWNIDGSQIENPFVVVSDTVLNSMAVCRDHEEVGSLLKENGLLRVVLPLQLKE